MSTGAEGGSGIAGRSIEQAVETVCQRDGIEEGTARAALDHVADEDGIITPAAAETSVATTATVVATPETRAELAGMELERARDAAEGLEDVETVAVRLEVFQSRLEEISGRIDELGSDLRALTDRDPAEGDLFAIGRDIGRIRSSANELQVAADELQGDIESFREWLDAPTIRLGELEGDIEAFAEELAARESTLDALENRQDSADPASDAQSIGDPGQVWADVAVGHRVAGLVLEDLRVDLADLRTVVDRRGGSGEDGTPRPAALADRLADLEKRRGAVEDRLAALAGRDWRERFEERIGAVEEVLADAEPPVAWGELQAALEDART